MSADDQEPNYAQLVLYRGLNGTYYLGLRDTEKSISDETWIMPVDRRLSIPGPEFRTNARKAKAGQLIDITPDCLTGLLATDEKGVEAVLAANSVVIPGVDMKQFKKELPQLIASYVPPAAPTG